MSTLAALPRTLGPAADAAVAAGPTSPPDGGKFDSLLAKSSATTTPGPPLSQRSVEFGPAETAQNDPGPSGAQLITVPNRRAITGNLGVEGHDAVRSPATALATTPKSVVGTPSGGSTTRRQEQTKPDNQSTVFVVAATPPTQVADLPTEKRTDTGRVQTTTAPAAQLSASSSTPSSELSSNRRLDGAANVATTTVTPERHTPPPTKYSNALSSGQRLPTAKIQTRNSQPLTAQSSPTIDGKASSTIKRSEALKGDLATVTGESISTRAPGASSPTGNPSSLAQRELPGVASQLLQVISPFRQGPNGSQSVTVSLHPMELGEVHVSLTVLNGETSVRLIASTPEGAAAIRSALGDLESQLITSGQRVHVTFDASNLSGGQQGTDARQWTEGRSHRRSPTSPSGAITSAAESVTAIPRNSSVTPTEHLIDIRT